LQPLVVVGLMATESPRKRWERPIKRPPGHEWLPCNPFFLGDRAATSTVTKYQRPCITSAPAPSMSCSLVPTTSGGAHVCLSSSRPRRRSCFHVSAAASVPQPSDGVGRRGVSLAGVAAWLAATVGRKCYLVIPSAARMIALAVLVPCVRDTELSACRPPPNCCRGRSCESSGQVRQEVLY
jgi:hypothetical protein